MSRHNKLWFVASSFVLPLMLAACGGGGGAGSIPDISTLVDGRSEGSVANPVQVTVGVDRPSSVGTFSSVSATSASFYTFRTNPTPATATATIALRNPLVILVWELFSDANFTNRIFNCGVVIVVNTSCTTPSLTANTTYYLRVFSVNPASDRYTLRVDQP